MRSTPRRLLCAALLGAASVSSAAAAERTAAELMDVLMWNREPVGGPFSLVEHTGIPRSDADFRGRLMLVYFGFTYCPDLCPTDLHGMAQAVEALGPAGEQVQPIFITLDPERDTAGHLAGYVPLFHPRLIGLTGDGSAIRNAAQAFKVYYEKVGRGADEYTIDHSGFVYLMDREGRYLGFFPPNTPADRMVKVIQSYLTR